MSTYYDLLGLAFDDPAEKIRARYRLLARDAHPDRGGCQEVFRSYAQAYRTLRDSALRTQYNQKIGIYAPQRPLHPGYDLYQRVQVLSALAQQGGQVPLTFDRYEPCPRCWLAG